MEFHQTWSDGQVRLTINILDFGRDQPNAKGQRPGGGGGQLPLKGGHHARTWTFQNGP